MQPFQQLSRSTNWAPWTTEMSTTGRGVQRSLLKEAVLQPSQACQEAFSVKDGGKAFQMMDDM